MFVWRVRKCCTCKHLRHGNGMQIGDRLKIAREAIEKNQKEAAAICDVSYRAWQGYETGENQPGAKVFDALVNLGFDANWLLSGIGNMWRPGYGPEADRLVAAADRISAINNMINGGSTSYSLAEGLKNGDNTGYPDEGFVSAGSAKTHNFGLRSESYPPSRFALGDQGQRFKLLRDIIETYLHIKPESDPIRLSRDIVLIYRHFLDHYEPQIDEVEITDYIEEWL